MNASSFRSLLLALVMVTQTIVGGSGLARSASADAGAAAFSHCDGAIQGGEMGGGHPGRHQHCDACSICAAPSNACVPEANSFLIWPQSGRRIVSLARDEKQVVGKAFSPSRPARGPPAEASGY